MARPNETPSKRTLLLAPLLALLFESGVSSDELPMRRDEKCVTPLPARPVPGAHDALTNLIDAKRRERQQAENPHNSLPLVPPVALPDAGVTLKDLSAVEQSLRDLEAQGIKRSDSIQGKLEQLKQALKEKERRQMEALIHSLPKPEVAVVPNEKPIDISPKPDDPPPKQDQVKDATASDPKVDNPPVPTPPIENVKADFPIPTIEPEPALVTDKSINRLKLADSLFGSGETELAAKIYGEFDLTKLDSTDRSWVKFQIASCHRRMGKSAEAESLYRALAAEKDAGVYAETARWWLDRISTRKTLESTLLQINQAVQTLEKPNGNS